MADKNKMNEIVYYTNTGKKYHFNPKCSYIKNKKSYKIVLGEAIKIFEGACYRCNRNDTYKSKTSNFGINNNFNFNTFQKNKNNDFRNYKNNINEKQKYINIKERNQISNTNNNNLLNISKEEKKDIKEHKKSSSDILSSSSSSYSKIININKLSDNKEENIDLKNINSNKIYKEDLINLNKFNHKEKNKNINYSSESDKNNSIIKLNYNKILLKKGEENKKDIIKDVKKDNININIINNNSFGLNKSKNNSSFNFLSDINNKNSSASKSLSEPKNNSFRIFENSKINSGNNNIILNNIENEYFSSFSNSRQKTDIKINIKKNNIININENILSNINFDNSITNKIDLSSSQENVKYIFSFKIIPKNKNKINLSIELGFEVVYIEQDNSEEDESSESSSEKSISFSSTYQKFFVYKNLNIHKKTNIIIALLDICNGKFYIIKNNTEKLDLSFDNNIILSSSDCQKISSDKIKEINSIFKYDSKNLNNVDIIFNGKSICQKNNG